MVRVLRSLSALLLAAQSYLRVVFVLLGAALALALGIADFTVLSLISEAGTPTWAVLIGVVLVGGPLMVGVVPAVRQIEGVAVQSAARRSIPGRAARPCGSWSQRRRTLGWFLLHLLTGALVVAGVIGLIGLAGSWWTIPAARGGAGHVLAAGCWPGSRRPCSGRPTLSGWSVWRPTPPGQTNVTGSLVRSTTASGMPCRW